jgi:hypothetical protein
MTTDKPRTLLRPPPIVAAIGLAKLGILLWCATSYGYFRDELYYLACARRLAWGYVDHPPLSIALLAFVTKLYGQSLLSMRVVPAVVGTLVVFSAARLARRFGAGALGQGLAALAVVVAPELLGVDHVYSMNSLEVLFWTVTAGLVARAITADPATSTRAWLNVGVAIGLGCLNKLTIVAYAAGLGVGLLATPQRVWLRRSGPWLALAMALALTAPYLGWERANGWPTLEFIANGAHDKMASVTPLGFIQSQLLGMLPTNAIVWGAGVVALLGSKRLATYRLFGIAFVVVFAVLVASGKSRGGYLAPGYPVVLAAGAAALDPWLAARRWGYPVLAGLLATTGAVAAPLAIPLLTVAKYQAYAAALHVAPSTEEKKEVGPLPQHYADMYGWPEMVRAVANVWVGLSALDRDDAIVLASNYGRAGAIEEFGAAVGLATVISGHNNYWLWGTGGASGRLVVAVGGDEDFLRAHFRSVEIATVFGHSLAMPYERHVRIYVCRDSVAPLAVMWPEFKHYE